MFGVFDLVLVTAYAVGFFQFHTHSRRRMLSLRFLGCLLCVLYFYAIGADFAVIGCMIAALGIFMQVIFPDHMLSRTRYLRTGFAIVLACAGIAVSVDNVTDLWPLLGVIGARLVEIQACPQRIRLGSLFSQMCWTIYAFENGLILMVIGEQVNMMSNLYSIWRHEQKRKKLALIPAPALVTHY